MARTSGLLLHLTSLPSRFGIGDLGPEADKFAEFCSRHGILRWQVLPLTPVEAEMGGSPYSSPSAFAFNPLVVSPEQMVVDGWLEEDDLPPFEMDRSRNVDFRAVRQNRYDLLMLAFVRVEKTIESDPGFMEFVGHNAIWLNDYAIFSALRRHHDFAPWTAWEEGLRRRDDAALATWGERLSRDILFEKFRQYIVYKQWKRLRDRLSELGVQIVGDVPIYVTHDSVDCWANQHLFKLDDRGEPTVVAGVPPDYFSETGQRWGNPVYNWDVNKSDGFGWWVSRLRHYFGLFDVVRLDHFRALAAYWEIPAHCKTAVDGHWIPVPGYDFLARLKKECDGNVPLIAEDLGVITQDVVDLRNHFNLPGMKVVQFAFGADMAHSPNAPHQWEQNCVAYTGTHDNNTARGWYEDDAAAADHQRLADYLDRVPSAMSVCWDLTRLGMASAADHCIVPVQDILCMGGEHRMNVPGVAEGNWTWRLLPGELAEKAGERMADMIRIYGRDGVTLVRDSYSS